MKKKGFFLVASVLLLLFIIVPKVMEINEVAEIENTLDHSSDESTEETKKQTETEKVEGKEETEENEKNKIAERFKVAEILGHTDDHYIIKNANDYVSTLSSQKNKVGNQSDGEKTANKMAVHSLKQTNDKDAQDRVVDVEKTNDDKPNDSAEQDKVKDPVQPDTEGTEGDKLSEDIDYLKDTDNDGLSDYLEQKLGTDPTNPDTDDDGLPDGYECFTLGTDPLKKDSDSNGVNDGDEDFDGDGLSNLQEYSLNGNPFMVDTDSDGLDDYQEYTLGTRLDERDTDSDGIPDGKEIELDLDPLNPDSNANGMLDGDEIFEITKMPADNQVDPNVVPSITLDLPGELIDTLEIDKVSGDNWYIPDEMPGYIGAGYEFNLGGEFDKAELSFKFNKEFLELPEFDPAIYYVDEENQEMILLENQEVDLGVGSVTATIHHFSKYILLNKTDFEKGFKEVIKLPTEPKNLDIVFVIDRSYSMEWNDPNEVRKEVSKNLISSLEEDDRVGVISFSRKAYDLLGLTKDKLEASKVIDSIVNNNGYGSDAGTALHTGLRAAINQFITANEETHKIIVALTDGEDTVSGNYKRIIDDAKNSGIIIHTVGLTDVDDALLDRISKGTGGEYFNSQDAEGLRDEFEKIRDITVDLTKDTDEDGLSDYHEQRIRIFNGTYRNTDIELKDTDGDTLEDGEEIVPIYKTVDGVETIYHYKLLSDPTRQDSDGDGIKDAVDLEPLSYNITDRTLALVAGLSYSNLSDQIGQTVGEAIESGVSIKNLDAKHARELNDAKIIHSNESGLPWLGDFDDKGLGNVAVQISRPGKQDAVIYGLRGTEFEEDLMYDGLTDIFLTVFPSSLQSRQAFLDYQSLATNKDRAYFVTGHSLGGRLTQDVNYKVHNSNHELPGPTSKAHIKEPVHSATFNGLGYNRLIYVFLKNKVLERYENKLHNYYYKGDWVGEGLPVKSPSESIPLPSPSPLRDAGKDMGPWVAVDEDNEPLPTSGLFSVHGIKLWHDDKSLRFPAISIIE